MSLRIYLLQQFVLCYCLSACIAEEENVVVEIENGELRGNVQFSLFINKKYYAFKGMPYAAPPIGELRFKAPESASSWVGIRSALEYGNDCVQADMLKQITGAEFQKEILGDEDCLFLNVFTPELPRKDNATKLRAVMVWIHGGSFKGGSGSDKFYGPDFLLEEDVVLVTINYRLGPLGFLNLENIEAPGNYGLKDQIKALQWVKQNIMQFGGDPGNVTIFGVSAGAAMTHLLMVSPLAEGLFHKVISESGSLVNSWALNPPNSKEIAFEVGRLLGKETTNSQELLKFLRSADAHQLTEVSENITTGCSMYSTPIQFPFAPTVEPHGVEGAVFTKDPMELFESGQFTKLPVIIGHTTAEYIVFLDKKLFDPSVLEAKINNLQISLPQRDIEIPFNSSLYEHTANEVKSMYLLNGKDDDLFSNYIQLNSDLWFSMGMNIAAEIQTRVSTEATYFYRFSYDGGINAIKMVKNVDISGTSHGDELCYQFACKPFVPLYKTLKKDSQDLKMIRKWSRLFSNFAKTGNPTPSEDKTLDNVSWLPRTNEDYYYLNLGKELTMDKYPKNYIYQKWSELLKYIEVSQDTT